MVNKRMNVVMKAKGGGCSRLEIYLDDEVKDEVKFILTHTPPDKTNPRETEFGILSKDFREAIDFVFSYVDWRTDLNEMKGEK